MNTKSFTLLVAFMACLILGNFATYAQDKPKWAKQDVSKLNNKRHTDTYEFVKFHTHSADINQLRQQAQQPLRQYVMEQCGAQADQVSIFPVAGTNEYKITVEKPGVVETMMAKLVDQYDVFEDYDENNYQFEYYQLYAVTKPNVEPLFDDIKVAGSNNAGSVLMSLVPGLSQFYKGQNTKGTVIIAGEVAFVGAAIALECKRRDYKKHYDNGEYNHDSWKSKVQSMRVMRDISIGLAAGLYIYNIIDGITSKGPNRIIVDKAKNQNLTIAPVVYTEGAGVGMVYTF